MRKLTKKIIGSMNWPKDRIIRIRVNPNKPVSESSQSIELTLVDIPIQ